ncbi:adenylate kinase [Powellomyces hirtus]|uniref:Adenylate kinase n=1 Tax=Powellomyces hirtus TaxID=109895 RepID=A0A507DU88_9FUNG|nr:adenylate kinase [Powellomyces hirtus]
MNELLPRDGVEALAAYADKHELFDLFESITARMVIEKPDDVIQFMIEQLQKPETHGIVIIGPPTAGQARASEQLALHLDAVQISTGRLLSTAIERQTSLGSQARPYLERGDYVPDNIMLGLVSARLQDPEVMMRGFVLEGFPRTKEQAKGLISRGIIPTRVIVFDVPDEVVVENQTLLRIDPMTNRLYHARTAPPPDNPTILGRLIQRQTDTEAAVRARLSQYRRHVGGVLASFDKSRVRRIVFPEGVSEKGDEALSLLIQEVGNGRVSRAPRMIKAVVGGLPGSGKTEIAEMIAREFGVVAVSPRSVILEKMSLGAVDQESDIAKYAAIADNAPDDQVIPLIVARLKREDCMNQGWVLDGFPRTRAQAEGLREKGVMPNRLLLLRASPETCKERLMKGQTNTVKGEEIDNRLQAAAKVRSELQLAYSKPRAISKQGRGDMGKDCISIIQDIEVDFADEGLEKALDRVRAAMIRGGNISLELK